MMKENNWQVLHDVIALWHFSIPLRATGPAAADEELLSICRTILKTLDYFVPTQVRTRFCLAPKAHGSTWRHIDSYTITAPSGFTVNGMLTCIKSRLEDLSGGNFVILDPDGDLAKSSESRKRYFSDILAGIKNRGDEVHVGSLLIKEGLTRVFHYKNNGLVDDWYRLEYPPESGGRSIFSIMLVNGFTRSDPTEREHEVFLHAHSDILLPRTAKGDNQELANLNMSRFSNSLKKLEQVLGGEIVSWDSDLGVKVERYGIKSGPWR